MTTINRRDMITGVAALLGSAHLPFAIAAQQADAANGIPASVYLPKKPKDLLCSTYTPELLSKSLISASEWHPYPKAAEREPWQQIPKEIADAIISRAEKAKGAPWESLPATVFLEFKREGNRSHFERYYFDRRTRLADLALGECVEGGGRFLGELINGIWLVCEETFWGLPAHLGLQKMHRGSGLPDVEEPIVDLFAAETGATMSWIHYLLGAQLDLANPMITPRIQFEVKRRFRAQRFPMDVQGIQGTKAPPGQLDKLDRLELVGRQSVARARFRKAQSDCRKNLPKPRSVYGGLFGRCLLRRGRQLLERFARLLLRVLHFAQLGRSRGKRSTYRSVRPQDASLHCGRSHRWGLVC
jgi:hypothetical protein